MKEHKDLLEEQADRILEEDLRKKEQARAKLIKNTFKDLKNRDYSHLDEENWFSL